jgi:ABC-type amino acid transport substrate-binding protein
MGMRKGNTKLETEVDKNLKAMLADGTIQKFAKKNFAEGNIQFPAR